MNKKEGEQRIITIHWWSFGTKKLDFQGTTKDYLIKRDIKVTRISHPNDKIIKGYRFKIPLSSSITNLDMFSQDYVDCAKEAIKTFLCQMGDKSVFIDGYGRKHQINWR